MTPIRRRPCSTTSRRRSPPPSRACRVRQRARRASTSSASPVMASRRCSSARRCLPAGCSPSASAPPADLRQALDDAEIRWRVVVVSACYAGVFLDELKSDTTAIITAADATHTSFGCEDDRELTWFGEAFLKDSLTSSPSLEDAFHKAAALVARREDAEHQAHSNPQLYVGPLMRRKLAELPLGRPGHDQRSFTVAR
ncbi:MAG: hypothetical protein E6K34_04065 [Gammaproteobacteria bacterium]|nr:MAG: hypothetical protein E6K34_04065 [Gammaproteobacteria bacterium]